MRATPRFAGALVALVALVFAASAAMTATASGTCRGPNRIGSVNGNRITWRWRVIATTRNGLAGTATYSGVYGADGFVRGTWTHSARRGYGPFTAQRFS